MGRKLYSGKVRDIYEVDSGTWLMVTSDRISAFDVVLPQEIPDKGKVLTAMTAWWLEEFKDLAPNHVISFTDFARAIKENPELEEHYIYGRSMLVKKAEMLPIECIVRGYISGSSWKEYKDSGTIHHEPAPAGLKESDMLENPIFTPSTKATEGHDENITFQDAVNLIGKELAEKAKDICVTAYLKAREICNEKGIIVADTKFELGIIDDKLSFCDEVLTPDSSRVWPKVGWRPG
jgi:phosphoribosylaminoimidazole-succinocarboxamide synthase